MQPDIEKEAFRVWALNRMKKHANSAKVGRWEQATATAACTELWAALDKVLGLGIADPSHNAYLIRNVGENNEHVA